MHSKQSTLSALAFVNIFLLICFASLFLTDHSSYYLLPLSFHTQNSPLEFHFKSAFDTGRFRIHLYIFASEYHIYSDKLTDEPVIHNLQENCHQYGFSADLTISSNNGSVLEDQNSIFPNSYYCKNLQIDHHLYDLIIFVRYDFDIPPLQQWPEVLSLLSSSISPCMVVDFGFRSSSFLLNAQNSSTNLIALRNFKMVTTICDDLRQNSIGQYGEKNQCEILPLTNLPFKVKTVEMHPLMRLWRKKNSIVEGFVSQLNEKYLNLNAIRMLERKHLKTLTYSCQDWEVCGGFGDRLKGLAGLFYLAVATGRAFHLRWEKSPSLDLYFDINHGMYDLVTRMIC